MSETGDNGEIVKYENIADAINAKHAECINSAKNTIFFAIEVGRLLCEAKSAVGHGHWTGWVDSNCDFDRGQASRYMLAYKYRALVEAQIGLQKPVLEGLAGALAIIREAKEPRTSDPWPKDQATRRKAVEAGRSVTANLKTDDRLIRWAQDKGLFVRIDRSTDWGNPYVLEEDGDRETILEEAYPAYLQYKISLHRRYEELRGKVLGCWCYPEACHGDVLIREAYGETAADEPQRVGCHS